jgi:hypothetical protein
MPTFKEHQQTCEFRGWDSEKCNHQDNRKKALVGSCKFIFCPLKGDFAKVKRMRSKLNAKKVQEQSVPAVVPTAQE